MAVDNLAMGIDLGTAGVRIAIINKNLELIYSSSICYQTSIKECQDWKNCCEILLEDIPKSLKAKLKACAIDGTSGTLIACDYKGNPLGEALPYYTKCIEQEEKLYKLIPNSSSQDYPSLGRALKLLEQYGTELLLRHQADWVSSWLSGNWQLGEASNNIKLGWDIEKKRWPKSFINQKWFKSLPKILTSGNIIGKIDLDQAKRLNLPPDFSIIAGTTDSNAAVIAANPSTEEGVSVLGSTIVLKKFVRQPLYAKGITNHYLMNKWLCGGSSNTGGRVLKKFFNDNEIDELSKQINPEIPSRINLLPLPHKGERFPIDDPNIEPILTPRPVSDALYLQALLEGLAQIEFKGWLKLIDLGMSPPKKIITIGSGAKNFQWQKIREKIIGIPISKCMKPPALGVAIVALKSINTEKIN